MRFILLLAVLTSSCAYVGDPKPPTLDLPATVTDLRALEYGDKILIEFTLPPLTTEGLPLSHVRAIELQVKSSATERIINIPAQDPGAVKSEFPIQDWISKPVTLAVRATGPKNKTSAWSNVVGMTVAPALGKPSALSATSEPTGVQLTWNGSGPRYRIFRSLGEAALAKLDESDKPTYLDTTVDFGAAYRYFIQALAGETRQSEISDIVSITPLDKFPPAVPSNVSAVAGSGSMELSWDRNTETDFAGYNIYRSENGGAFEQITGSLQTPVYSDRAITAGRKYFYAITAVDQAGNESARSVAAEITAP